MQIEIKDKNGVVRVRAQGEFYSREDIRRGFLEWYAATGEEGAMDVSNMTAETYADICVDSLIKVMEGK